MSTFFLPPILTFQSASAPRVTLLSLPNEVADAIYTLCFQRALYHVFLPHHYSGFDASAASTLTTLSPWSGARQPGMPHFKPLKRQQIHRRIRHRLPSQSGNSYSLLLVCKQTNAQATRILYSQSAFEFTSQEVMTNDVEFATYMLLKLSPITRGWLRNLYIPRLEFTRVDFGLSSYPRWVEGRTSLEKFFGILRTMEGLREVGFGISLPSLKYWGGRVEDVEVLRPLIDLAGPEGIKVSIVLWWIRGPRRPVDLSGGDELAVINVAEAMKEMRLKAGWAAGVEYVETEASPPAI